MHSFINFCSQLNYSLACRAVPLGDIDNKQENKRKAKKFTHLLLDYQDQDDSHCDDKAHKCGDAEVEVAAA